MTRKRRRRTTWLVVAVGSFVLVLTSFAAKDKVVEQWYLGKLKSDDREEQRTAIQVLGEMRSALAAPKLVELFREQNTRRSFDRDDRHLREALVAIGEPAVRHLIELTRDRRCWRKNRVSWSYPIAVCGRAEFDRPRERRA